MFMIFAPPHYSSKVKGYSQLFLCEAPNCCVSFSEDSNKGYVGKGSGCGPFSRRFHRFHFSFQILVPLAFPKLAAVNVCG